MIESKMAPIADLFNQQNLSGAELTGLYIISVLSHRFPGTWLGAKRNCSIGPHELNLPMSVVLEHLGFEPNIKARLGEISTLGVLFSNFAFRSTPLAVNRAILKWSTGDYGLELMFRIPTPHEVLSQQKHGRRCVSVLWKKEQSSKFVLDDRDALSFTMHDLIHSDHFYHDNHSFHGQLGFYGFIDWCLCQGHFRELMEDEDFKWELEYFIADMNAYAIHLMKCFKSALIHYHPGKMAYFEDWLTKLKLSASEREALVRLNGPLYNAETDDAIILSFLNQYRRC